MADHLKHTANPNVIESFKFENAVEHPTLQLFPNGVCTVNVMLQYIFCYTEKISDLTN